MLREFVTDAETRFEANPRSLDERLNGVNGVFDAARPLMQADLDVLQEQVA